MMEPGPPLAVREGYAVVNDELSMRTLAFVWAGTVNACSGKAAGAGMPVARTILPAGTSFISIAGSGSGTSCQALGASDSPRSEPRWRESGLLQACRGVAASHCQS